MSYLIPILVPILALLFWGLVFSVIYKTAQKKTNRSITIIDQKIAEFKAKNFASPEEKEKAKEQLKSELVLIINQISTGFRTTALARQRELSKLIIL